MAAKKTILFELVLNRIDNKSKEGTKIIKKDITFALSRLLDGECKVLRHKRILCMLCSESVCLSSCLISNIHNK
ncbi:hypothetical protein F9949_04795 [Bacteroides stercoris]|uniref:Uncharacterized protein n=1 Tax=Bacteroides stercoris TaxID=46506 RepID=A0A412TGL9_BACSE|nr:hypothetical protein F9952_13040 [Bacteroides stercoris]KAB5319183.1 hypothetical protein F9949_04795 [Bacteroides stercoris]KAB5329510.1 hypothetical protein F9950_04735 [Bacteroides stercoris]KAB5335291.1 hypothetical protein F9956_05175 [Bacteroides stercoris]KAB5336071.1 hypothetical protein F9944_05550 [Bacteroides stercoris]